MKLSFGETSPETLIAPCSALQPGVEQIPEGVAENIEAVDDNHQSQTRPDGHQRREDHVRAYGATEQSSPGRIGRGDAQTKEAEAGFP